MNMQFSCGFAGVVVGLDKDLQGLQQADIRGGVVVQQGLKGLPGAGQDGGVFRQRRGDLGPLGVLVGEAALAVPLVDAVLEGQRGVVVQGVEIGPAGGVFADAPVKRKSAVWRPTAPPPRPNSR